MKCIYCSAEIKDGELSCPSCGKEVQLVPDYNILDDEYLKKLLEEEANKEKEENAMPREAKLRGSTVERVEKMKDKKEEQAQKKRLIIISVIVVLFVAALIGGVAAFKIKSDHANSFDYQIEQAQKAVEQGETEKAISYYERAIKLEKDNVEARIALGTIYLEKEDLDSALVMFEEAVNLEPDNVDAYKGLLSVYDAQGEYEKISGIREEIEDIAILEALSDYLVEAPSFSEKGGTYDKALEVTLSSSGDCSIYYTTDGKDPVKYGEKYTSPFQFDTDGTYTIWAVCVNANGVYSEIVKHKYVIDIAAPTTPIVSPEGGNYVTPTQISIAVPENCTAYYTWDGTDPNITSSKYSEPIEVPLGSNVLSVIIVDNETEKISPIYRSNYTYYEQ